MALPGRASQREVSAVREEDEIRAAVIALAEAQAAGEDVSAELPHGEVPLGEDASASPFKEGVSRDEQRDEAIALVLEAVRAASRKSCLSRPCEWAAAGLVPPAMTAEDVEMAVYEALMEHGEPVPEGAGAAGEGSAQAVRPVNRHVHSAFSSSNGRCVGASPFKHKDDPAKEEMPAETESLADSPTTEECRRGVGRSDRASSAATGTAQWAVPPSEDCLSESECPAAPTEVSCPSESGPPAPSAEEAPQSENSTEGVSPDAAAQTPQSPYDCAHIRLLMGASSYYLYDASAMTDAYARWAFLAAEDDPVTTFIECVREESAVYPRPMARTSLANEPFSMGAEAVEAAFAEARAQGRADDIERACASNGDVYFYSTRFLGSRRAEALAEWDAVERLRNV